MLRIVVLGCGRIGQMHAANVARHPRAKLAGVYDLHAPSAEKVSAEQGVSAFASAHDVFASPDVDAVLIATATPTHADYIEMAIAAGKAVLCEKPVDLSLARAQACQKAVAQNGRPVMIGFNRRFDPNFAALKAALDKGEIGKPELLSITSFDPAPPPVAYIKVSGGLFRDMMIHDFDMANFLMGGAPVSVSAVGSSIVDPAIGAAGDVDTAVVTLTYADGRIAVIKNSRRAVYGYDQRVELLGSEGLLQAQNMLENTVVKSTTAGVTGAKPTYFFLERYMPAYRAEWAAFVAAVNEGSALPVTLADGVAALAMAEAATLSLNSCTPVRL